MELNGIKTEPIKDFITPNIFSAIINELNTFLNAYDLSLDREYIKTVDEDRENINFGNYIPKTKYKLNLIWNEKIEREITPDDSSQFCIEKTKIGNFEFDQYFTRVNLKFPDNYYIRNPLNLIPMEKIFQRIKDFLLRVIGFHLIKNYNEEYLKAYLRYQKINIKLMEEYKTPVNFEERFILTPKILMQLYMDIQDNFEENPKELIMLEDLIHKKQHMEYLENLQK